jgi:hypothetical protein
VRRTAVTAVFTVLLASLRVRGAEETTAPQPLLSDVRQEMLSEYKFTAPGTKAAPLPSSLHSDAPAEAGMIAKARRDVVTMAPFEVRDSGVPPLALMPAVSESRSPERKTVAAKLGIGVHRLDFGKVHMFVNTVFYVPFLVGFEW